MITSGMSDKPNNNYIVGFKKAADNQLLRLERKIAETIIAKLLHLARAVEIIPRKALKGEWVGCYSLRVGGYRVIYTLENQNRLIIVEAIGHRREVYDE